MIESIINKYDDAKINEISNQWWSNNIFIEKKEIIQAGLESYLENTTKGNINAIKTLSTEIEGIIYNALNLDVEFKGIKNFKNYIKEKGLKKFFSSESMFFPENFYEYLTNNIFCNFEKSKPIITPGRHAFAHGAAKKEMYSRERALQIIMTIDQIYYYL